MGWRQLLFALACVYVYSLNRLTERLRRRYMEVRQGLAARECHICKRLLGEHSNEEYNAHVLGDASMEIGGVFGPSPHDLHFARRRESASLGSRQDTQGQSLDAEFLRVPRRFP